LYLAGGPELLQNYQAAFARLMIFIMLMPDVHTRLIAGIRSCKRLWWSKSPDFYGLNSFKLPAGYPDLLIFRHEKMLAYFIGDIRDDACI
jgi:hypothetical protein